MMVLMVRTNLTLQSRICSENNMQFNFSLIILSTTHLCKCKNKMNNQMVLMKTQDKSEEKSGSRPKH